MNITCENQAYEAIAEALVVYIQNDPWEQCSVKIEIYDLMIRAYEKLIKDGEIIDEYREIPFEFSIPRMNAAFFLNENKVLNDELQSRS